MLYSLKPIKLPPYTSVKHLENTGNFAVSKYYKFPYNIFYTQKLKMALKLFPKRKIGRIMDFGAGPAQILLPELQKRTGVVKLYDPSMVIDTRWRFDVIVCCSVIEFCPLPHTLKTLYKLMNVGSKIIIASPMNTRLTRAYFDSINDKKPRHSHQRIISEVSKIFKIEEYITWFGLYFALRASKTLTGSQS